MHYFCGFQPHIDYFRSATDIFNRTTALYFCHKEVIDLDNHSILNKRSLIYSTIFTSILIGALLLLRPVNGGTLNTPVLAPAFTHSSPEEWLNSEPLIWDDLNGKVVLIDFWTFDCWNCYRSFP